MKTLVLDGVEYVKVSEAAKAHGYTSDYVGQLCRSGKVEAHLVGRSWYVRIDSLLNHRKGRYRSNQKKAKEAVATAKAALQKSEPHFKTRLRKQDPIAYEADTEDLLPQPQKVAVVSEETPSAMERAVEVVEAEEEAAEYYLETTKHEKPTRGNLTIVSGDNAHGELEAAKSKPDTKLKPVQKARSDTHSDITARIDEQIGATAAVTRNLVLTESETNQRVLSNTKEEAEPLMKPKPVLSPVPVLGSLALSAIVVSLLIGIQWHFEGGQSDNEAGYRLSLSSVIQSIIK